MCGISFIYHAHGPRVAKRTVERMNRALDHRGPDERGVVSCGDALLGHTRLSIVDIEAGHQPMATDDGRFTIAFNGEIYNYRSLRDKLAGHGVRFRTQSDTEVVLEIYRREGPACLHALRGMFAFVIYDREASRLFVARDRLGIKPLFYHWDSQRLVGASEVKALFASGLVAPYLEPSSIKSYFIYQFAISPNTPFTGVFELPPGYHMTMEKGGPPVLEPYWDLEFPRDGEYESHDEAYWTTRLTDALNDSAKSHTIGDVPIGSYLSGGIDSATMTWLLGRHYRTDIQTFSIHFTNASMDESSIYREIAHHLGAHSAELTMDDARPQSYLNELSQCVYHLEQPQRLAVDIPHFLLSKMVHSAGYKVVFTGDGADEIFGGYDCYRQDYMRYWGNQLKNRRLRRRHYLTEYTQYFAEDYIRMLLQLHTTKNQRRIMRKFGCYPAWHDFWHITAELLPGLFTPEFEAAASETDQMGVLAAEMKAKIEGRHVLNQSLYIETKTRLPGWILWKSDRLSMAHGVEARVPFMDHALVELAARMPPALKLQGMEEKYLLKKIMQPNMPQHPDNFKKRAFYTPIREWFFTAQRRAELEPYLSPAVIKNAGIFNEETVTRLQEVLVGGTAPKNMNEYYRIMQLEWILLSVLTVQILHSQFVGKQAPCFQP